MPVSLVVKKVWNRLDSTPSAKPEPVSATGDLDHVVADSLGRCDKLALRRGGHRLQRVAEQVDQHLLDLHAVDEHEVMRVVEFELQIDALFPRAGEAERAGFLDQLGDAFNTLLRFAAGDEIAQPADDLPGAQCLFGGAVHRAFDLRPVRVARLPTAAAANPSCSC